ncbi:hypothetical protein C1N77_04405 [Geobacillus thermoleovorans]
MVAAAIGRLGGEGEAMRLAEPIVHMALAFIVFGVLVGRWLACRGRLLTDLRARKPTPLEGW